MTSKEQAQVAGTLQKLFMLCLKYPTAENLALAKETMEAINLASIQTKDEVSLWHYVPINLYTRIRYEYTSP